jgi:MFS transporter, SP family, sugar:H+ symporter
MRQERFADNSFAGDIDFLYGFVFAGCNIIAGAIVVFFVMEGQGRSLEELDTMYVLGVKPWHSAKWEAPSAEELSTIRKKAGTEDTAMEDGTFAEEDTIAGSDDWEMGVEHREL